MNFLRQSTAASVMLGPAVDNTNGYTPETGLTIAQADLRLTKDGAVFAQKNDVTSASHAEFGWYNVELDATDTGTVGRLLLAASATGALPMWREFMVVPANTYDSLVGGTDNLDAEVATMAASTMTACAFDAGAVDAAAIAAGGANKVADHTIRRTFENAGDSSDGDTKTFRSLLGAIGKQVNKVTISGGTLTVYEDDDTTSLGTQTVSTTPGADPITTLDTD